MKQYLFYGLTVALLWSCASKPAIDFDTSADFSAYKSYAWSDQTDEQTKKSQADASLVHKRIRESIEATLQAKGMQSVDTAQADVLVTYHLSMHISGYSGSSVFFGLGSFSHHSAVGVSVGVPVSQQPIEEGTLVIDIIDAKKNSLVWQGAGARTLSRSVSPEKAQAMIDEVVKEILAGYPPKK
ncbi:MAG: DUF4136 domain-containing protein [Gammaproteobacteria bacterium]|nr:DUF4136 domain-containing protein [Gammaproteobacteria bacterium]